MGWIGGRTAGAVRNAVLAAALAAAPQARAQDAPGAEFARRVLTVHNLERDRVGVPRLGWSDALAARAADWARELARRDRMEHSSFAVRSGAGENLWMGTRGFFGPDAMVGAFVAERKDFRPGVFPAVSTTGNWEDIGHYSQLVWAGTSQVGCALASSGRYDYLVCRYWPAGNVVGMRTP